MQTFKEFIDPPSWMIIITIDGHGIYKSIPFKGTLEQANGYADRLRKGLAYELEINSKLISHSVQPSSK